MSAFLLIAPAIEPLSLGEAKLFLRVEHGVTTRSSPHWWPRRARISRR